MRWIYTSEIEIFVSLLASVVLQPRQGTCSKMPTAMQTCCSPTNCCCTIVAIDVHCRCGWLEQIRLNAIYIRLYVHVVTLLPCLLSKIVNKLQGINGQDFTQPCFPHSFILRPVWEIKLKRYYLVHSKSTVVCVTLHLCVGICMRLFHYFSTSAFLPTCLPD